MAAKKYYAVKKGKSTGIFQSWEECRASVEGYPGAVYKGFPGLEEAEGYLGLAPGTGKISGGRSGSGARAKAPGRGQGTAAPCWSRFRIRGDRTEEAAGTQRNP